MSKLHFARRGVIILVLALAACGGSDNTVQARSPASPRPAAAVSDTGAEHHQLMLQDADAAERWAAADAGVCEAGSISADAAESCRDARRYG